jgi:hypothetical protein
MLLSKGKKLIEEVSLLTRVYSAPERIKDWQLEI